jgi:hypothetical protein
MTIDPDDEKVAAAFASLKAESSAHFPPPPVNELIMRGPAALRRRRLVSLAAVVGACTAVTAGGFAVAQTLGPLASGPDAETTTSAAVDSAEPEGDGTTDIGDPASPDSNESGDETATVDPEGEPVLVIEPNYWWDDAPDAWSKGCETGPVPFDPVAWEITGDSLWEIVGRAPNPETPSTSSYSPDYDEPTDLDADGDADDMLLELGCDTRATGVALFTWDETGTSLELVDWVWEPEGGETVDSLLVASDGVITLGGYTADQEPWEKRYKWDTALGEIEPIVVDPTTDPTPDETTSSPAPGETPTTDESPTSATTGS